MKVVLDANVLISAIIAEGPSNRIVSRWLDHQSIDVVVCPTLLAEVEDVLGRSRIQKRVRPELAQLYMSTMDRIAEVVADPVSVTAETRDPKDDYLVALGREHTVDYIVTGDKDLLEWPGRHPPVITPAAFDQLLRD